MPCVKRDVATGRVRGVNAQQVRVLARRGLPPTGRFLRRPAVSLIRAKGN